ncbi:MAG: helix-turn-helix domain-containing protein [Bacteroidota bacterium]
MQNLTYLPVHENLLGFIHSYGLMTMSSEITMPLISSPNGLTGFLIRVKDIDFELEGRDYEGRSIAEQQNYVIGQTTFPIVGSFSGQAEYIVVFFEPLGLYRIFGCDMSLLANKTLDLKSFLGDSKFNSLYKDLINNDNSSKRIEILDSFFLSQKKEDENVSIVLQALKFIHQSKGNVSVKALETSCGVNRRMLERQFQTKIGLSPKIYAQIFRFKYTMNYLAENPNTSWAELSNIVGYFDQSHLIRYFKEYLKTSPSNIVSLNLEFMNYFLRY